MIPLIVIRPEPGCTATLAAARAQGLEASGFPLSAIAALEWDVPDEPVDALLIGSANAIRHGGPGLNKLTDLSVYAVGSETAGAAQAAGFIVAATGTGGLQDLLVKVEPLHRRLLRLCGSERIALDAGAITIVEREVYVVNPLAMPADLIVSLRSPAVVMFHAAAAARHFAAQCDAHGVDREKIAAVAIGPRVADAAGDGWAQIATALRPDDTAMLALAGSLCQSSSLGTS